MLSKIIWLLILLVGATSSAAPPKDGSTEEPRVNQYEVRARMFEIDRTQMRKLGVDIGPTNEGGGYLSGKEAIAVVQFLESLGDKHARTISQPWLVVAGGKPAQMRVGGEVPLGDTDPGGQPRTAFVGSSLGVTAQSVSPGRVELTVNWKVTEIGDCPRQERSTESLPCLNVQQTSFTSEVADGETIAVMGPIAVEKREGSGTQREERVVLCSFRANLLK